MDTNIYENEPILNVGIPYDDINWEDTLGQPFGSASSMNLFVFGDANNIVDVEGPIAIGGSFYSPRGLSVGFERKNGHVNIEYSPDLVRYLIGGNVSMNGPLVVVGHAVTGGRFQAANGSTYLIGKDHMNNQMDELKYLYYSENGSPYWTPSDKGDHYLIPSYDTPRVISPTRIRADLSSFFQNAYRSMTDYKNCIEQLPVNGSTIDNYHEWILRGNDPRQNVFLVDVSPNGLLNKGLRVDIPDGSIAIIRIRSGNHAHLQYGLYGDEAHANHILYVFEDATDIHMEVPADIWGSILAPQATFHGHPTGGHVSGNAALGAFAVNANSGFEFHMYPFVGNVLCGTETMPEQMPATITTPLPSPSPVQEIAPQVMPAPTPVPNQIEMPAPVPTAQQPEATCPSCPEVPTCPEALPCPTCPEAPTCPEQIPCPTCPETAPCPTCPEIPPCPDCPICPSIPEPTVCPICPEIPEPTTCPICPEVPVCPTCPEVPPCPSCPEQEPCPQCPVCPECPTCPEAETQYVAVPYPVPISISRSTFLVKHQDCFIQSGIILGSVWGCNCRSSHEWDVMLYSVCKHDIILLYCIKICNFGYFNFEVPFEGTYLLKICPSKRRRCAHNCNPKIIFKNVGVANLMIEK
ncbi:choice-of-anchor A family protein [Anaeromicropila herbilytica]|uniref:Choice-of-anchor A domain-containing protein n=1 Tax=Anaeromicropila herbilytica TaxID=2785025 RepID=A0A7R7EIW1_9FIRM|nr:choice-of-anchor A family protein [Anaeromicropila herbilytica]BCN29980.1 hypothetical protein bsdtb5_12750 [Anaeromicropila herbilytica]